MIYIPTLTRDLPVLLVNCCFSIDVAQLFSIVPMTSSRSTRVSTGDDVVTRADRSNKNANAEKEIWEGFVHWQSPRVHNPATYCAKSEKLTRAQREHVISTQLISVVECDSHFHHRHQLRTGEILFPRRSSIVSLTASDSDRTNGPTLQSIALPSQRPGYHIISGLVAAQPAEGMPFWSTGYAQANWDEGSCRIWFERDTWGFPS